MSPDRIQAIAAAVQAGCSLLLFLVTCWYVRLTNSLVHAPHVSYLRPTEARSKEDFTRSVTVHNFGPGLAVEVRVRSRVLKTLESDPLDPTGRRAFTTTDISDAEGPHEIPANTDATYVLPHRPEWDAPIFVAWSSPTGRHYSSRWSVEIGMKTVIRAMSFGLFVKHILGGCFGQMMSPFYSIWKRFRFWKASRQSRPKPPHKA